MGDLEQDVQNWGRTCMQVEEAISEQQHLAEMNYDNMKLYLAKVGEYEELIDARQRKIARVERMIEDADSLPAEEQLAALKRLRDLYHLHNNTLLQLYDEQAIMTNNFFASVDNVSTIKKNKETLDYQQLVVETNRYAAICQQQMQEWFDEGCKQSFEEWSQRAYFPQLFEN